MTNEEIEQAYNEAFKRFREGSAVGAHIGRYFFFAGAEFGLEAGKKIYNNTHSDAQEVSSEQS